MSVPGAGCAGAASPGAGVAQDGAEPCSPLRRSPVPRSPEPRSPLRRLLMPLQSGFLVPGPAQLPPGTLLGGSSPAPAGCCAGTPDTVRARGHQPNQGTEQLSPGIKHREVFPIKGEISCMELTLGPVFCGCQGRVFETQQLCAGP